MCVFTVRLAESFITCISLLVFQKFQFFIHVFSQIAFLRLIHEISIFKYSQIFIDQNRKIQVIQDYRTFYLMEMHIL